MGEDKRKGPASGAVKWFLILGVVLVAIVLLGDWVQSFLG